MSSDAEEGRSEILKRKAQDLEVERDGWKATVTRMMVAEERLRGERDQARAIVMRVLSRAAMANDAATVDYINRLSKGKAEEELATIQSLTAERDRLAMALEEEQELHSEARAERDRLREAIDAERPARLAQLKALIAERDRLRAVVRRAQEAWKRRSENLCDADAGDEWIEAWDALDALDVSGNTDSDPQSHL
jgi:hypothetical protein